METEDMDKMISRTAATMDKAITFDTEIAENSLKYSLWVLALATSGFALIVFSTDKLSKLSWLKGRPLIFLSLFTIACVSFLFSIFCGAWFYKLTNNHLSLFRQMRTLIYGREIHLLNRPEQFAMTSEIDKIFRENLPQSFVEYHFFQPTDERFKKLQTSVIAGRQKLTRLLLLQQILVGVGYLMIAILGFPNPLTISLRSVESSITTCWTRAAVAMKSKDEG